MMRRLGFVFFILVSSLSSRSFGEEPDSVKALFDSWRWEKRVLFVYCVEKEGVDKVREVLGKAKEGLRDRDMVVVNLSSWDLRWREKEEAMIQELDEKVGEAFKKKLKISKEVGATFVLFGKDGDEKSRQQDGLELKALFSLIDQMPMRQREMRE